MSQGNNNQNSRPLDVIRTVKTSAINHWQSLLPACGVDVPAKGKHGACPICGGTDRFHFIKDPHLPEKISRELPIIIRHLLNEFADQNEAKKLLQAQRDSNEALTVKSNSDPLYRFCGYLVAVNDATGMKMGTKNISPRAPRMYLYHAYLSFMEAHGFERPLTLTKFGESLPKIMLEYKKEYRKVRTKKGYSYNVELSEEAEEWLPSVPECRGFKSSL